MDCSQRITQIKKYILLLILSSLTFVGYAQKQNYMYNFTSESQLRRYLADNVATLDPAEGVYDVQFIQKNGSPFAQNSSDNWTYFIVKDPNSSTFTIYTDSYGSGISKSDNVRIESIGETNAYRLYWHNSSNRAYLENNLRLSTTIQLSQTDARNFAENPKFAHWITLTYDMVKRYPTASMYTDAVRKQVEETKPAEWTGTGFALTNNYIVTNYHVVENAKTITVQGIKGSFSTEYKATVIATDKFNDLALIKISDSRFSGFGTIPYRVKTSTAEVGEDVFVLGYPLTSTMGDEIKLTTGVVSSKTGFQGDVSLYQISAPIQPGNSGGPLFDGNGNLIGIVNAKHKGAENVGYAIKASYLNSLVESAASSSILPSTNSVSGQPLTGKVKNLKNFVFMIKCSSNGGSSSSSYLSGSHSSGYNSSNSSNNAKTINNPSISNSYSNKLSIRSVSISSSRTSITMTYTNPLDGGWMNIDPNAYIVANGQRYTISRTSGIEFSPKYTWFSYKGETKTFTLYFPAIPQNTSTIDFVENTSSEWRIYGISLKTGN